VGERVVADAADDGPVPVVEQGRLAGVDGSLSTMQPIPGSRMFEIRDALAVYRHAAGAAETFDASQGDGGASLPGVPLEVLDEAHRLQVDHGSAYDQPFGCEPFRRAVVEDYWRLDATTGWGPANVLAAQGGRDALVKAYDAILSLGFGRRGDFIVVSRVPWISYNWGPYSVGANVMLAPGEEAAGWPLTPAGVEACVERAASVDGRKVAALVVTSPDNPTGRTEREEGQVALARAALAAGVPFVLFDWMYHRVSDEAPFDLNRVLAALTSEERERCLFLDGITKSLGGSNIRNAHLLGSTKVIKFIQNRASHTVIPSFHSQAVAMAAYRMGFTSVCAGIVGPTNDSRRLLRAFLAEQGIRHVLGQGYYAFLDLGPWIDRAGMADSAAIGAYLAERHGLAVVPGVYFSRFGARWIRFSYALPPDRTSRAAERLAEALAAL
jgi:aspartate aminotransferase